MGLMESNIGYVPGFRRAHARGIGLRGHFVATPAAAELTTAEHLQGATIPVIARLSNGAGSPYAPDRTSEKKGNVLGFGVRLELPSGATAQMGALNIKSFPARKPDDFINLTAARAKGLPFGLPNPLRFVSYLLSHPVVLGGVKAILGARRPRSSPPRRSSACTRSSRSPRRATAGRFATAGYRSPARRG